MARFRSADADIRWHGVDDDTPPGHTAATGTDLFGTWLWLFKGDEPTDDAYVGGIQIPDRPGVIPNAYSRGGGWAGLATDTKATLARLAERAKKEG